jgi:hypothetical protein
MHRSLTVASVVWKAAHEAVKSRRRWRLDKLRLQVQALDLSRTSVVAVSKCGRVGET